MNKENLAGIVTAYNNLLDVLENNDSTLAICTEREREIIKSFFGIGVQKMTFEEMGEKYALPPKRVQKMMEKAIRRLKYVEKNLRKS